MVIKLKNNLRVARAEHNISQEELANMVGASRQTILAIENERFNPSMKLGMLIALALNKKIEELFYLVEE
ncbi:MAG TPA: helix-turn-helix transcriptional regulator [Mollicutes bacterium]|nr:helix-turn-helix transcriptional regulator [Mollicutes bacterium]